jgi:DNA-binding MarR family transcriptional regulator
MQQVFRRFGALDGERTPCGQPLSVAHAHALMVLRAQGELTQQALGAELGIDKSNVARLCAKMAEAGHVVQRVGDTDARSRCVSLTARGQRLAGRVDASSRARFCAVLREIPVHRRGDVIAALGDLAGALGALSSREAGERRVA